MHTLVEPLHALSAEGAATLADNLRLTRRLKFREYKGLGDERIMDKVIEYVEGLATPPHAPAPGLSVPPPSVHAPLGATPPPQSSSQPVV